MISDETDRVQEFKDFDIEGSERTISRKSVSYSDKEVTVLGIPEEIPQNLFVKRENVHVNCASGSERSRQIQPSSHVAPSHLPNGDVTEESTADDYDDNEDQADDEDDEVPALPSVRLLTNKFQTIAVDKKTPDKNARSKVIKNKI